MHFGCAQNVARAYKGGRLDHGGPQPITFAKRPQCPEPTHDTGQFQRITCYTQCFTRLFRATSTRSRRGQSHPVQNPPTKKKLPPNSLPETQARKADGYHNPPFEGSQSISRSPPRGKDVHMNHMIHIHTSTPNNNIKIGRTTSEGALSYVARTVQYGSAICATALPPRAGAAITLALR